VLRLSTGTVGIGSFKPFGERQAGLGTGLGPLIVAALVVMNESLVTRMVSDLVSQCRIPSFGTSYAAPTRLAKAQDSGKKRSGPSRTEPRRWRKVDASASQFHQYRFLKGLSWLGYGVDPECERSRFEQIGDRSIETWMLHRPESLHGASLLGSGIGQAAGAKDFRGPLFQRRPPGRCRVAPIGFRPFPCRPGLLGAEVAIGVVHHGIEPALGSCRGESVSGDPVLQRPPNAKIVHLFPALAFQESGAPRLQFGSHDLWKLLGGFANDSNPQNDHVPLHESRRTFCQLLPRHHKGPLQGLLLAVAPYVENEVCGVSFRHPRPVSGGGRLTDGQSFITVPTPVPRRKGGGIDQPSVSAAMKSPPEGGISSDLVRPFSDRIHVISKLFVNVTAAESAESARTTRQEDVMPRSSMSFRVDECRAVIFWLLLLGNWQFLASSRTGAVGAIGTGVFLLYAWANIDRLRGLGLDHACWRSTARANWVLAGASGSLAGMAVFVIGTLSGQNMRLGDNWKLIVLQVTLGPVLEEVVFRGYLFSLLMWLLGRVAICGRYRLTVVSVAVIFAVFHLSQPGVSWLQLVCITSTGMLYGWIRWRTGSAAPAAVSHAVYNLALYSISGAMLLAGRS